MKAVLWTAYGDADVLQVGEAPVPQPGENEVLVRIAAAQVSAGDCEMRSMKLNWMYRLPMRMYVGTSRPQRVTVLGQDFSGVVEAVGAAVKRFKVGDAIYGTTGMRCGGYAEYICLPEASADMALAHKPAGLSHTEATCLPVAGLEALHYIRKAALQPGETLLINGAGGGIGTVALQLARHYGAEVTAVDAADKLERLQALGAGRVIDYRQHDFTRMGERYDVLLDVVGSSDTSRSLACLKPGGRYLVVNPGLGHMLRGKWGGKDAGKQVTAGGARQTTELLVELGALVDAGAVHPVVDRTYRLEQAAEAHRFVESGSKMGCVVLEVG